MDDAVNDGSAVGDLPEGDALVELAAPAGLHRYQVEGLGGGVDLAGRVATRDVIHCMVSERWVGWF